MTQHDSKHRCPTRLLADMHIKISDLVRESHAAGRCEQPVFVALKMKRVTAQVGLEKGLGLKSTSATQAIPCRFRPSHGLLNNLSSDNVQ